MTDILICGINGKMGREVYSLASQSTAFNVVCGVDKHTFGNFDCPVYTSLAEVNAHFDAIIDFSSPTALEGLLAAAREYGCALLICTTGHSPDQLKAIDEASKTLPVRLMPNTSQGIAALSFVLPTLCKLLSGFDVCITETHRKGKKDAPSGTARALARLIPTEAQLCSFRAGDVPGTHTVSFYSGEESVSITHTAFSRRAFAEGALKALSALLSP